ncbi:site-2 protease family protein [Paenibacillus xylanilyticus]|uniref:Site-2 protease family protein n=1 Tax=Paenibacillus xylanilyticus TaxID=248903 RepID=A0A7Y6ES65_9BACL|nr:site-2 protease family protein [Paenibacillus xylanilyticus]NUU74602.1 site-2 protease family protein [Paenibacillus xylanilyticus]
MILSILAVVMIFMLLVISHEFGHFIIAKKANVGCPEFSIGMGPRLFSFTMKQTRFVLRLFPIGGYVRMAGDDETYFIIDQELYLDKNEEGIAAIYDRVNDDQDLEKVLIKKLDHKHRKLTFLKGEDLFTLPLSENAYICVGKRRRIIPVSNYDSLLSSKSSIQKLSILLAGPLANILVALALILLTNILFSYFSSMNVFEKTLKDAWHYSTILIYGLKDIILGNEALSNLSGPAGVMKQTFDIASYSTIQNLMIWAAIMNLNVAIFNLLPLPALDGGRVLVTLIGMVRPISAEKEGWIHFAGFLLMIGLTILATWNDIIKFLQ